MHHARGGELPLVSLFCGACNVEAKLAESRLFDPIVCNDKHKYLIKMLRAVQDGYELPDYIPRALYERLKHNPDVAPVLAGFVGFGVSFGGKWFDSFIDKHNGTGKSYCVSAKSSLLRKMSKLQNASFLNCDYRDVPIPAGAVVYCDPPYADTHGYSTGAFDSTQFWQYVRELSQDHMVFVSEQTAPSDFKSIWSKQVVRTINNVSSKKPTAEENLYIHDLWAGELRLQSK